MVTEVEDRHEIELALVLVGNWPLEPRVEALVGAIREAASNAARHAGVEEVSVYVEVESDRVEAFVRDRGRGFDPAAVNAGRLGIKESIIGRMARHGGRAEIHSEPGGGTEVGWLVCGFVFVAMGGVPLLFLLSPRIARWSLWGPNSVLLPPAP